MPNYYIPQDVKEVDLGSKVSKFCFEVKDCTIGNDLLIKPCDELYNANKCGKACYYNPYHKGTTIDFQTSFIDRFNVDPANPTDGWGTFIVATVCDEDGEELNANHLQFADEYVVFEGYQTIRIDTNKMPNCWTLKVQTFDADGNLQDEVCSEPFAAVPDKVKLICIEGKYDGGTDCKGGYYETPVNGVGSSNFVYNNKICFKGAINYDGFVSEDTSFNNRIKTGTTKEVYTVKLGCPVPPYIDRYLGNVIFKAESICVNGKDYLRDATISPENLTKGGCFLYSFQIYTECKKESC